MKSRGNFAISKNFTKILTKKITKNCTINKNFVNFL